MQEPYVLVYETPFFFELEIPPSPFTVFSSGLEVYLKTIYKVEPYILIISMLCRKKGFSDNESK